MKLNGKKIAVLGAGGSGFAAATLALAQGASVTAFDSGNPERLAPAIEKFRGAGIELVYGEEALAPKDRFDISVLSPGIATTWPIAVTFSENSEELIGEIEFAWRLSEVPVIAITGTNGKTTTTSLIAETLRASGLKAVAAGNIGLAYSEVVLAAEELDWVVLEVSSFQLETIDTFAPSISVWMNFAPDHLDRYESVQEYRDAKLNLFRNAGQDTLVIRKFEDAIGATAPEITFSAFTDGADFGYANGTIIRRDGGRAFDFASCELQGKHNSENVMVSLAVADRLDIDWEKVSPAIQAFRAPAHRCEKVAVVEGVVFLNDSKSTNLHSLESALAGQESPAVLIVGGKNKGLDFSSLNELVGKMAKEVVCIGEIGPQIASIWNDIVPCTVCGSVEEAVAAAFEKASAGDVVLFSPGTSSFDMFTGYEARGEAFRAAVTTIMAA